MEIEIDSGIEIIKTAYKKQAEEMLYQQWLIDYSHMDKEHFMSFEQYKTKAFETKTEVSKKLNIEEILKEAEKIKNYHQLQMKGGNKNADI